MNRAIKMISLHITYESILSDNRADEDETGSRDGRVTSR